MSTIQYGVVDLGTIVNVREISRQASLSADRSTFQTIRWVFDVDTVWNPVANSWRIQNPGATDPLPQRSNGLMPAATDTALQQYLLQQRRRLTYKVGEITVLDTPTVTVNGIGTDALNGPTVEFCTVTAIHGDRTFAISIRITCDTNKGPGHEDLPILLSHRWRRFCDISDDHLAQVVTEGFAQFRVDQLRLLGVVPDQFRPQLFHPLPGNMARESVRVAPTEAGDAYWYRVVDTERHFNIGPPPLVRAAQPTRVEAYCSREVEAVSLGHAAGAVIGGLRGAAGVFNRDRGQRGAGVLGNRGTPIRVGFELAVGLAAALPTFVIRSSARAWGNRQGRRDQLAALVAGICTFRVDKFPTWASTTAQLGYDVTGKMVEMEFVVTYRLPGRGPPKGNIGGERFNLTDSGFDIITNMPNNGFFGDDTSNLLFQANGVACAVLPNSSGTRGTWLGTLMAQGLSAVNSLPPQPGAANIANNVDELL